uniref:Uncharacterized protein n=1 Tax=Mycena chlorophos TaxID=658473 RepID=A0ABQ0LI70_MYCCL|nr:predicted protein [Mycena chlorophos]
MMCIRLALIILLSTALGASSTAVVAQPRNAAPAPSASPASPYNPSIFCDPSTFHVAEWYDISSSNPAKGTLACVADSNRYICQYDMSSGNLEPFQPSQCSASPSLETAVPSTSEPCGYRCPTTPSSSSSSLFAISGLLNLDNIVCTYKNGAICTYSTTSGQLVDGQDDGCSVSMAPSTCGGATRRRYRREDNLTAMLKRKAAAARDAPMQS